MVARADDIELFVKGEPAHVFDKPSVEFVTRGHGEACGSPTKMGGGACGKNIKEVSNSCYRLVVC